MSMEHLINKMAQIGGIAVEHNSNKTKKRNDYISWDQYFMGLAVLASKRSKDPNTQVGAAIIDPKTNRVVSVGYNGFTFGCSDNEFPWGREEADPDDDDCLGGIADTKYAYVVHAELNAILSAKGRDLTGCSIYITSSPCNECMKAIIQSGITRVVYRCAYGEGTPSWFASNKMAEAAGISVEKYNSEHQEINLGFL